MMNENLKLIEDINITLYSVTFKWRKLSNWSFSLVRLQMSHYYISSCGKMSFNGTLKMIWNMNISFLHSA
jgi:hypothetical protein